MISSVELGFGMGMGMDDEQLGVSTTGKSNEYGYDGVDHDAVPYDHPYGEGGEYDDSGIGAGATPTMGRRGTSRLASSSKQVSRRGGGRRSSSSSGDTSQLEEVPGEDGNFEVDCVIKRRVRKGVVEYLTVWKGFAGQDSWEPEGNFVGGSESAPILLFEKQQQRLVQQKRRRQRQKQRHVKHEEEDSTSTSGTKQSKRHKQLSVVDEYKTEYKPRVRGGSRRGQHDTEDD